MGQPLSSGKLSGLASPFAEVVQPFDSRTCRFCVSHACRMPALGLRWLCRAITLPLGCSCSLTPRVRRARTRHADVSAEVFRCSRLRDEGCRADFTKTAATCAMTLTVQISTPISDHDRPSVSHDPQASAWLTALELVASPSAASSAAGDGASSSRVAGPQVTTWAQRLRPRG